MKLSQFCSAKHANTSLGAYSCSCRLINPLISRNSQHPEENFKSQASVAPYFDLAIDPISDSILYAETIAEWKEKIL